MRSLPAAADSARLQRLAAEYGAPDYVLEASSDDLFAGAKIASQFADRGGLYPVHTKAAAWLSAAAFADAGGADAETGARLQAALKTYGVGPVTVTKAATDARAAADAARAYALPAARKYPLDLPEEVKAAADYFATYADRLGAADRREFAANLAARAGDLGALPPATMDRLQKEAGMGLHCFHGPFEVRAELADRTGRPELADALRKAAAEFTDPKAGPEAAAVLRDVDRRCGWDLPDPIDGLTPTTPASAREKLAGAVEAASGNWYRLEDLERVPPEVSALYGLPPVASAEGYGRLLRSKQAAAFEEVAADYGALPVERPTRQVDWAGLAAAAGGAFA